MTVTEVKATADKKGHGNLPRRQYTVNFLPKLRIEVAVRPEQVDRVVELLPPSADGQIGDGKIFVTSSTCHGASVPAKPTATHSDRNRRDGCNDGNAVWWICAT